MPARYVNGYLYTGDANDAASHAWIDAWLGAKSAGQADVTHTCPAVRNCTNSRSAAILDAAPVRGMRPGGGAKIRANVLIAESALQQQ